MIAKAAERGCYRQGGLHVADLVAQLKAEHSALQQAGQAPFSCLVAADVFVYIGDLQPVLCAAAAVAAPG